MKLFFADRSPAHFESAWMSTGSFALVFSMALRRTRLNLNSESYKYSEFDKLIMAWRVPIGYALCTILSSELVQVLWAFEFRYLQKL